MDFQKIDHYLKETLNDFRYQHTLRVVDMGVILADKFNYKHIDKVKAACYFHDSGKNLPLKEILKIALNEGYKLDECELENVHIFHGVASMVIARDVFKIHDLEILNAIKNHVTGTENMSVLDKIVFLADFFEIGRDSNIVGKSRDTALIDMDLNKSLLLAYNAIINELLQNGKFIHYGTIKARNYLLKHC